MTDVNSLAIVPFAQGEIERERGETESKGKHRGTARQTDRRTDRLIDRLTDRQTDRHRHTD